MKKCLYLFMTIALVIWLSPHAFSHPVPPGSGECRAPEACYECHGGHIIIEHDCSGCHDYTEHPFPVDPGSCHDCHKHPPTEDLRVNVVCQECHDPLGDPPFIHPDIPFWEPPAPPEDCALCNDCHLYDHPGPEHKDIDCEGCHETYAPDVDPQCSTCHTAPEDFKKYDLGCERGALSVTGLMTSGRFVIETETLEDGRFLITGGLAPPYYAPVNTAETLNPKTRKYTATSNPMTVARTSHTLTPLQDGTILIIGGRSTNQAGTPLASAEIYDPEFDTFTATGSLVVPRRSHRAILLDDGRVLVTGGGNNASTGLTIAMDTAEVYNPSTGEFTLLTSTMSDRRQYHNMEKMSDGKVLVIGGGRGPGLSDPVQSVDIFNPADNSFTDAGDMIYKRMTVGVSPIDDDKVLLAFAWDGGDVTNDSEILSYDVATSTVSFELTSEKPVHGKVDIFAVTLLDGTVLMPLGGNEQLDVLPDTTLYRPETDDFVLAGATQYPNTGGNSDLLKDGRAAFAGGFSFAGIMNTTEIYTPSIIAQTSGFRKVIADMPNEAFLGCPGDGVEECDGDFDFDADVDGGDASTFKVNFGRNDLNNPCSIINPCVPDFDSDGDIDGADASKFKHNFGRNGYHRPCSTKKTFLKMANHLINKLDNCNKCHGGDAISDKMQEYEKARETVVESMIPRMDGCAGGDPEDDWIIGCENQELPYSVATLLLDSLDQTLGNMQPPVLTVAVDQTVGTYPLAVEFTATAVDPDGTIEELFWDFDDGVKVFDLDPAHTYYCPGDYTAVLTAIDNDGLVSQASVDVHVEYPEGVNAAFTCDLLSTFGPFCGWCHFPGNPPSVGAGLNLTSYAGVMAGSVNGPVVSVGDPFASPIFTRTGPPPCGDIHPTTIGGERLQEDVREKLKIWIEEGALNN